MNGAKDKRIDREILWKVWHKLSQVLAVYTMKHVIGADFLPKSVSVFQHQPWLGAQVAK